MNYKVLLTIVALSFTVGVGAKVENRDLTYREHFNKLTHQLETRSKTFEGETDQVFVDGWGREVNWRGWNMNNRSKDSTYGFKPYKDPQMAKEMLELLEKRTGSNILRWLFHWEGGQPAVDEVDLKYFDEQSEQIRVAISKGMYVFLDFHQDTFSNHIKGGANGAPKWVVDGIKGITGKGCGKVLQKICDIIWSVHYVLNKDVIRGLEAFWNNEIIKTAKGDRVIQDQFVLMIEKGLKRIKENLSEEEFQYILGLDPWNEPHYGGKNLRKRKAGKWVNEQLFPFYKKMRAAMDRAGWEEKYLYAEPHMLWNVKLPVLGMIGSGTGLLKEKPKGKWVFNFHFYDEHRQAFGVRKVKNGAFLGEIELAIKESRNWGTPMIVSEFKSHEIGGTKLRKEVNDPNKNLKANYQAFEMRKVKDMKSDRADFYSPFVSTTQWEWGMGPRRRGAAQSPNINLTDLGYPSRVQGEMMNFYNNIIIDSFYKKESLHWVSVRINGKDYFEDKKFMFLVWRGRKSDAPTEIYVPSHYNPKTTLVMTNSKIQNGLEDLTMNSTGAKNEILFDFGDEVGSTLHIFDDVDQGENQDSFHFALVVDTDNFIYNEAELEAIQNGIKEQIAQKLNPLHFLGKFKIDRVLTR